MPRGFEECDYFLHVVNGWFGVKYLVEKNI